MRWRRVSIAVLAAALFYVVGPSAHAAKGRGDRRWSRFQGRIVRKITFSGLKRTRHWRLRQCLDTRVGRPFDAETFAHDVRRLRNRELFRFRRILVRESGPRGVAIHFDLFDKWSLLPFFNAFLNLGSVNVITGIYDVNLAGSLFYLDGQLLLFSYLPLTRESIRPGGVLWASFPRLGGLPLRYYVYGRAQMTVSSAFGDQGTWAGSFQVEHYSGRHYLEWEPFQWLRLEIGQRVEWNRYRIARGADEPLVPVPASGLTHALQGNFTLGYTRYRSYLMHGLELFVAVEGAARRLGSDFSYAGVFGEARGYYNLGRVGGNLVGRLGAGYMKGGGYANLFALGSWTGLRGFYTAQFRARSYVVGNVEYRTGLLNMEFPIMGIFPYFHGRSLALQGAVFVDAGGVAGAGPYRTAESGQLLLAIGAGFRAITINLYRAILRVDFAYTLSPYRSYDLIIATQQYF